MDGFANFDTDFDFTSARVDAADGAPPAPLLARAAAQKVAVPALEYFVTHAGEGKVEVPFLEFFVTHAQEILEAAAENARLYDADGDNGGIISEAMAVMFTDELLAGDFIF